MNLPPLLLPGTSITPNKDIYQFGNTLKEGQFAVIESVEPDKFFHVKDENGHKFTISLTEINLFSIIYSNDNRPRVSMETCLPGQVLISKSGKKYVFIKKDNSFQDFPYRLASLEDFTKNGPDYYNCSRTVEGWTFRNRPFDTDHDIITITDERVFTFEQVKAFLEENPHVMTDEGIGLVLFVVNDSYESIKILCQDENEYCIEKEDNPTISLVNSSFFAHDSVQDDEIQFQILAVKSNF